MVLVISNSYKAAEFRLSWTINRGILSVVLIYLYPIYLYVLLRCGYRDSVSGANLFVYDLPVRFGAMWVLLLMNIKHIHVTP